MSVLPELTTEYKRHTCIICKRKRYEIFMKEILVSSWVCTDEYKHKFCSDNEEIKIAVEFKKKFDKFKYINVRHLVGR